MKQIKIKYRTLGTLATSIIGITLAGWGVIRAAEGRIRASQYF